MGTVRIADAAICDLAVRLVVANGLAADLLERVLGIPQDAAADIVAGVAVMLTDAEREKLMLFCAILTRLEIRLGHDTRAVQRALGTPLAALDDCTPLSAVSPATTGS